jgi:hypothetical protein
MSKSFISYEFSPAERLLLLRGIHLMLSDLYEEIYFFGFYNDGNEDDKNPGDNVLGFISSQEEDDDETEESNFFEDSNQYKYDYLDSEDKENHEDKEDKENSFPGFFDDDDEDFDELFDDDWQVDRDQMEKLITEIKVLENKLLNIDTEEDFPELDINELEILLDSAYEVKIQIEEEDEEEWEEDSDYESDPTEEEIRDAINKLANEDRKQIEEDYEFLVLKQHKDLSSLIYKIKEWIDNYQINSN